MARPFAWCQNHVADEDGLGRSRDDDLVHGVLNSPQKRGNAISITQDFGDVFPVHLQLGSDNIVGFFLGRVLSNHGLGSQLDVDSCVSDTYNDSV